MAGQGKSHICGIRLNMQAVSSRLLPAIVLGLIIVVAAGLAQAQTYSVIHNFQGGEDGEEPNYGLTIDADGNLYGTTFAGDFGTGTVYMLSPQDSSWVLTPLYVFRRQLTGLLPTLP